MRSCTGQLKKPQSATQPFQSMKGREWQHLFRHLGVTLQRTDWCAAPDVCRC